MKGIILKIVDALTVLLPFLKKKDVAEIKEFSDMVAGQLDFLVDELKKVLSDYFELSEKMKEMHTEIMSLRKQLQETFDLKTNRDGEGTESR
jgi:cell shape-determining protein MreC